MMGSLITSLETPVTKTTGGLLVLPGNHPLIQRRRQDERTLLAIARTVCGTVPFMHRFMPPAPDRP